MRDDATAAYCEQHAAVIGESPRGTAEMGAAD